MIADCLARDESWPTCKLGSRLTPFPMQVVRLADEHADGRVVSVLSGWSSEDEGTHRSTCVAAHVAALMGKEYHGGI
jgi:hypothetical protein